VVGVVLAPAAPPEPPPPLEPTTSCWNGSRALTMSTVSPSWSSSSDDDPAAPSWPGSPPCVASPSWPGVGEAPGLGGTAPGLGVAPPGPGVAAPGAVVASGSGLA
jgi:hypothetical protein